MIGGSSQEYRDDLAAYALDALDPERRREVEARLEADPELRAELEELQEAAAALAFLAPATEPPRALRARLLRQFELELAARKATTSRIAVARPSLLTRVNRRLLAPRLAYVAPAALVAAVAASAVSLLVFNSVVDRKIDRIEGQISSADQQLTPITEEKLQETEQKLAFETDSKIEETKAELEQRIAQKTESELLRAQQDLEALKKMVGYQTQLAYLLSREDTASTWLEGQGETSSASAVLASNRVSGRPAVLWVNGLKPPPSGKEYQLWLFHQGRMWSPGTFSITPYGFAWIEFLLPMSGTQFLQGAVTIEPMGGSAQPTGERVMTVVPSR